MAAIKRKSDRKESLANKKVKKRSFAQPPSRKPKYPAELGQQHIDADSQLRDQFEGLSEDGRDDESSGEEDRAKAQPVESKNRPVDDQGNAQSAKTGNSNASRESHAKQKALVKERKAAKPNAESIARSKKLWERLRIKSSVPREERKKLVAELFDIIEGRVKEFVFKHDSVRVIQTAVRYATLEQRKMIARELKGDYRSLAESKYAKFLIAKLMVHGDVEMREMVIPEFYGHVRRLIRHPDASWILDDIYRTIATPTQKAALLREWYGPEFALFKQTGEGSKSTAELSSILSETPEKRGPIMRNLFELINQLIQKKTTGFTILHDAMLQYFLNIPPDSLEATEFMELLKGDDEGDLLKNLAFTPSGAHLVCLTIAHGTAKDRKQILRNYKDTISMISTDPNGYMILLTSFDVIDDTVMTSKAIFPELLGRDADSPGEQDGLIIRLNNHVSRVPLLYLFSPSTILGKSLSKPHQQLLQTIHNTRSTTSKKDPATRQAELLKAVSPHLLSLITARPLDLIQTTFGNQAIADVLLCPLIPHTDKLPALTAIADLTISPSPPPSPSASPSPSSTVPSARDAIINTAPAGRMLKSLVQGGRFSPVTKKVEALTDPPLGFHDMLYKRIKKDLISWAIGGNSFVIVAMLEANGFGSKGDVKETLKANGEKKLRDAKDMGNRGAGLLVELISSG